MDYLSIWIMNYESIVYNRSKLLSNLSICLIFRILLEKLLKSNGTCKN